MGSHFYRTVLFGFVLATVFVDDALAKSMNYDPTSILLEFEPGQGVLINDSCVDNVPFQDPDDTTYFYHCFWVDDAGSSFWYILHEQCPPGGYFDPIFVNCMETQVTTGPTTDLPSTTEIPSTTEEIATTPPTTTEIPTTSKISTTTAEVPTTTKISTTEPPTTTDSPTTSELPKTTEPSTTTEIPTTSEISATTTEIRTTTKLPTTTEIPTTSEITTIEPPTTTDSPTTTDALTTTEPPTTELITTVKTITITPPPQCTAEGTFPDPQDTTKYFRCISILGKFYYYIFTCPATACFYPVKNLCRYNSCPVVTTTTLTPATTPAPFTCTKDGTFSHEDCTKYYKCVTIAGVLRTYVMTCPSNSSFNSTSLLCAIGTCSPTTLAPLTNTTAPGGTTAPTPAPTTPTPLPICTTAGVFPDPSDCAKYFKCLQLNANWYIYLYTCPPESYFDNKVPGCILGNCPATTLPAATLLTTISTTLSTTVPTTVPATALTITAPTPFKYTVAGTFSGPSSFDFRNTANIALRLFRRDTV